MCAIYACVINCSSTLDSRHDFCLLGSILSILFPITYRLYSWVNACYTNTHIFPLSDNITELTDCNSRQLNHSHVCMWHTPLSRYCALHRQALKLEHVANKLDYYISEWISRKNISCVHTDTKQRDRSTRMHAWKTCVWKCVGGLRNTRCAKKAHTRVPRRWNVTCMDGECVCALAHN